MSSGTVFSVLLMALICSAVQITCSPINKSDANTESNDESVGTRTELQENFVNDLVKLGVDEDDAEDIKSRVLDVRDVELRIRLIRMLKAISIASKEVISARISRDPFGVAASSLLPIHVLYTLSETLVPGLIDVDFDIVSKLLSASLGRTEEAPSMERVLRTAINEETNNLVMRLIQVDQQVSHERLGSALHSLTILSSIEQPNDIEFDRLLQVWENTFTKYSQYQRAMKNFLLAPPEQLTMTEGSQYLEVFEVYAMDFSTFKNIAVIIKMILAGKNVCQIPSPSAYVCQELLATIDIAVNTKWFDAMSVLESLHFPPKFFAPIVALYYSKENNDKFINMEKIITHLGGKQKNVNCFSHYMYGGVFLKSGTDSRKLLATRYSIEPVEDYNDAYKERDVHEPYDLRPLRYDCHSPYLAVVDIIAAGTDHSIHGQTGARKNPDSLPVTHTDPILKARYGTPNQAFIFARRPIGDNLDGFCRYFKTCVLQSPGYHWWACDAECDDNTGVYNLIQINSGSPSTSKTFIITEYSHSRHMITANDKFYQADVYDLNNLHSSKDFEFRLVRERLTAPCNDQGSTCPVQ